MHRPDKQTSFTHIASLFSDTIDWDLIQTHLPDMLRVAKCESNLNPFNVTAPHFATGLFQFLPSTWATTPYAERDIFDPEVNAYAAAWMWSVGRRNEWACQ